MAPRLRKMTLHSDRKPYEIRTAILDDGETLDEVIVPVAAVHFEHMGQGLWCGITLPDGRSLLLNVWTKRGKVCWRVEEDWPEGKTYE